MKSERAIKSRAEALGSRFPVRICRYANSGNHLHLLFKAPSRASWGTQKRFELIQNELEGLGVVQAEATSELATLITARSCPGSRRQGPGEKPGVPPKVRKQELREPSKLRTHPPQEGEREPVQEPGSRIARAPGRLAS